MKKLLVALILAVVTLNSHVANCGEQKAAKLEAQVKVQLGYLLYLPNDYDKQESWPLLLFFKGWEVYVWDEDGQTYFSLMIGTNRLKSADEIVKSAVKGFDAFKPKLDQLKKGESVFLHGRRFQESAPAKSAKAVIEYCKEIGLKTS